MAVIIPFRNREAHLKEFVKVSTVYSMVIRGNSGYFPNVPAVCETNHRQELKHCGLEAGCIHTVSMCSSCSSSIHSQGNSQNCQVAQFARVGQLRTPCATVIGVAQCS